MSTAEGAEPDESTQSDPPTIAQRLAELLSLELEPGDLRQPLQEITASPADTVVPTSAADMAVSGDANELGTSAFDTEMSGGGTWARPVLDVPATAWHRACELARDAIGLTFFDWLSAVDEESGGYHIVAHLWSIADRHGLLLRTLIPHDAPIVDSVVDIYPGAAWHERETFEMFGVTFTGHPDLRKLLLSDEFSGNPLRKDFVLASRVVKAWPGAVEPGEPSEGDEKPGRAPSRRKMLPPGVPQPGEWGPS